jgi:hypothetical protein
MSVRHRLAGGRPPNGGLELAFMHKEAKVMAN